MYNDNDLTCDRFYSLDFISQPPNVDRGLERRDLPSGILQSQMGPISLLANNSLVKLRVVVGKGDMRHAKITSVYFSHWLAVNPATHVSGQARGAEQAFGFLMI